MTLLNTIDVGGTAFGLLNNTVMGVCATPAGSEVKACTFADSFELKAGVVVTIKFTYANTYGDGSTTYPKLSVNGTPYPIKYATNAYAGAGAWINGQTVPFMFDGTGFILVANLMQTSVISSANTTVNGAPLYDGANVKVMFTSALIGTDTSTALVLNYNGNNITVKVPVNGALADYVAKAVDESGTAAYYFCQAYTTLELLFDGTYFVITNNPVVISNSDYVINADGSITYTKYWSDGHFAVKAFTNYVPLQGAIVAKYSLRSIINVDASSQYHFKFYALCNEYKGAYVEGQISIYGGVSAEILWSNNKITSVSVDNNTMELVINSNDNMYEGFLSIGNGGEWAETF